MSTISAVAAHDDHHGPEKGLLRWVKTTNHKDIGKIGRASCRERV